jgi:hypothetical protein
VSDQDEIVRALGDPGFYPHRPGAVEHVQTHISHVFLAGAFVYKLKKAVRFAFLDFSTPERRREGCHEELRLNRRLCPEVYLDVVPVTRAPDGGLRLGGPPPALDHVVRMRRLPAAGMLTQLLAAGAVEPAMMDALAARMAAFHAGAPAGPAVAAEAGPETLVARWEANLAGAAEFVGDLLLAEDRDVLADFGPTFVRRHDTLLRARQRAGRIREGHGDLHAEHVCFVDRPVAAAGLPALAPGIYVFDCIEFSFAFRCNDVASEIAFLAMDLDALAHPDLARAFVAAYAAAAADPVLPVLVPFYACYRACVRGKVEGLASRESEVDPADRAAAAERARRHFALAARYAWSAGGPAVIACAGLSGAGKSTLAAALAAASGFALVGTDALRRQRASGRPAAPAAYDAGSYTPEARAAVYQILGAEVAAALDAESGVVVDATFMERAERRRLVEIARRRRAPVVFLECRADEAIVRARLGGRAEGTSLSDARWDTYRAQRARWEPWGEEATHLVIETSGAAARARAEAVARLWRWRQGRPA